MRARDSAMNDAVLSVGTSAALKELFEKKLNSAMRLYLESCTRCGLCVESCHVHASMPQTRYTAVGRAEVVRRIFKRYFKLQGRFAPWLGETLDLNDATVDALYDAAFSCTGCRRCMVHCPFGIDTQLIMSIAKALLIGADREPKLLSMLADMSVAKGESIGETMVDFAQALVNLDGEVRALWPASPYPAVPYEVPGSRVLYVALAGSHSIVSAAAIMNAAGESWCLSSFEAVNFAAFVGDAAKAKKIAQRIVDEAWRLGVREVAVVECGTAFRYLKHMIGPQGFEVVAFVELIDRYIAEGRIRLDPSSLPEKVTYHDPCQLARNSGVIEEPRRVLRALAADFVEMTPNREENWCCGGGGGLVAMGEEEFRMKSSRVKAEQMRATGASVVVTACENCHSQLSDLNRHYSLGMRVEFLSHLAAQALVKG
ncbi:MAG: (Fe-S)-binding protein [Rectinemataceae bacterium]